MARITDEQRNECTKRQDDYRNEIAKMLSEETTTLDGMTLLDPVAAAETRFKLATIMINIASLHFHIASLSISLLGTTPEEPLVDARKAIYKSIAYLEEVVTNYLNTPFSDYAENTTLLEGIPTNDKFLLIRKIGLAIDLVESAFNESSKWRITFAELEGRLAIVAKNMVDMTDLVREIFDLQDPEHDIAVYYMNLLKKMFAQSMEAYNERFDLLTHNPDDIRTAANFGDAYVRILSAAADTANATEAKKQTQYLYDKYESNAKKTLNNN